MQDNIEVKGSLLENLMRPFFTKSKDKSVPSIPTDNSNIDSTLSDTNSMDRYTLGYFDDNSTNIFNRKEKSSLINKQNDLLKRYRKAAMNPEVSSAVEEIVNELAFVVNNEDIVYLDISTKLEANDALKDSFITNFNEILNIMNFSYNADHILKQYYIDGQLRLGCSYNTKDIKKGISSIMVLSPMNLYYSTEAKKWKYYSQSSQSYEFQDTANSEEQTLELSDEEMVTIDSGLFSEGVILSHLHNTLKIINQLSSLEDMLIPLRYSRSVSRRVFNVDVGELPYAKAMQAVAEIQNKFKYKKFYDVEHGTISNSTNIASIVEDYYFPSRNGKGTDVNVLDESGNLGETGDIEYFVKKLYGALKVPLGRLSGSEKGNTYDFTGTQIEQDEIRFFAFINRIRQRFNNGLIEILRRHMISKGLLSNDEFNEYKQFLIVKWEKESNFLERQNLELMKARWDLYDRAKDYIGDVYSRSWVLKNILKMSEEEIEQMKSEMEQEALGSETPANEPDVDAEENPEDDEVEDGEDDKDKDSEENPEEEPEDSDFGTNMSKVMKKKEV